jgi:hypothetical protein
VNGNDPGAVSATGAGTRVGADAHSVTTTPAARTIKAATEYHRRGWAVVPVPAGQKAAVMVGWPEFRATADDLPRLFGRGGNIAVILGAASGELVDIDFDCSEAPCAR